MGDAKAHQEANRGIDLDLDAIPLDDKAACDILTKAVRLVYSSSNQRYPEARYGPKPQAF